MYIRTVINGTKLSGISDAARVGVVKGAWIILQGVALRADNIMLQ